MDLSKRVGLSVALALGASVAGCEADEGHLPIVEPIALWCTLGGASTTVDGERVSLTGPFGGAFAVCRCATFSDFLEHDIRGELHEDLLETCLEQVAELGGVDDNCQEVYERAVEYQSMRWVKGEPDEELEDYCDASDYSG